MRCDVCTRPATHQQGEWQCHECKRWYYTVAEDGRPQTHAIYDREVTTEQMTQKTQVEIVLACRQLTARRKRFLVDFGWKNAIEKASIIGEPYV